MKGTLPPGVDGRYLLGIVRNIEQQDEGLEITSALLRARAEARQIIVGVICVRWSAIWLFIVTAKDVIPEVGFESAEQFLRGSKWRL